MHRRALGRPGRLILPPSAGAALTALVVLLVAGCGHLSAPSGSTGKATKTALMSCGRSKTAADVPVDIEIARGSVPCGTALTIEREYAVAIRSGKAPGNGGGGPVRVGGWTCEGFATPVVLKTGKASKCVKDGEEILAILPLPSGSSGSSGSSGTSG
ncbi:MAG: hypothetical protein ACYCO9_08000 [Streptosporangiaceae bacterium]